MKIKNLLVNLFKPGNTDVILKKVLTRFDQDNYKNKEEALEWYKTNLTDIRKTRLWNEAYFQEAVAENNTLKERAHSVLSQLEVTLGGGGNCELLYYLVRVLNPEIVLETGVAAGFSSQIILKALDKNQSGKLYSSDFPYFRLPDPEKYIGILVEPGLKDRWELFIKGDDKNLPLILEKLKGRTIDIFHYDSDKSYSGRTRAIEMVRPYLSEQAIVILDDIDDNAHFKDWIEKEGLHFVILESQQKLVAVTSLNKTYFDSFFKI